MFFKLKWCHNQQASTNFRPVHTHSSTLEVKEQKCGHSLHSWTHYTQHWKNQQNPSGRHNTTQHNRWREPFFVQITSEEWKKQIENTYVASYATEKKKQKMCLGEDTRFLHCYIRNLKSKTDDSVMQLTYHLQSIEKKDKP